MNVGHARGILLPILLLIDALFPLAACAENDWGKQLRETLQAQLQKVLFERFIRYDKQKNIVSFSPELMNLAADNVGKNLKGDLQAFDFKPEGNALRFSLTLKSGAHISAGIEPEALELGPEEMAIVTKLPQGMKIEGVDLQKTVTGFFDTLIGFSQASATISPASLQPVAPTLPMPGPSPQGTPDSSANEFLKTFSLDGTSMRLKRPWKDSSLGRALATAMARSKTGDSSSVQRLSLVMENGWLNLHLGTYSVEKVLMEMGMEMLTKRVLGN